MASVKIILTEEVEHLGAPGEIVNVAPGYARNFLFPKRVAMEATAGNLSMLENKRKAWQEQEDRRVGNAEALKAQVDALDARFERRSGDRGALFGSVTNQDIAEFLAANGLEIARKNIKLKAPIKSLGSHEATIKLHRKVSVTLPIEVTKAGEPETESLEAAADDTDVEDADDRVASDEAAEATEAGDTTETTEG